MGSQISNRSDAAEERGNLALSSGPLGVFSVQNPDYRQSILSSSGNCIPYTYVDPYYGGFVAAYGAHSFADPQMAAEAAVLPARVPLPIELAEAEPVYVNAKQYHRILRRRQLRAKLEAQNKVVKERKPYLHESRHLHAVKRARGSGGRFLNTKSQQEHQVAAAAAAGMSPGLRRPGGRRRRRRRTSAGPPPPPAPIRPAFRTGTSSGRRAAPPTAAEERQSGGGCLLPGEPPGDGRRQQQPRLRAIHPWLLMASWVDSVGLRRLGKAPPLLVVVVVVAMGEGHPPPLPSFLSLSLEASELILS
ncbi:unnamed protein product [Spirodela intermedia]|uniref:Nuclear transcription factor Y subunit n=1 Tax=Spirodela intermedia TaxID=51605 RepID=A0A7I8J201_SPIIN|nr:unnamed protein product [Spirodela intermedia]CAA6664246.1 unnamed protein product [Spirodela intermedia]